MAEKEKRIFIGFINPEGDACPVPYGKCNSLCDYCKGGMTRQEAIERMAKAFFKSWYGEGFEQEHPELKRRYIESAEAALDALLDE